jgi:hypothetical protein
MEGTRGTMREGLRPTPEDSRDFSHSQVFGALQKHELPTEDFVIAEPICIKNQGDTDFCTAYASCAVSEDQEGVELNPEYVFMRSKLITGNPEEWGQDLRTICKVHVECGAIQRDWSLLPGENTRDYILNPKNWTPYADVSLDTLALSHQKKSYLTVDGPYDTFDNMRMTLWMNRKEKQSIVTGCLWRDIWTQAPDGVIEDLQYFRAGVPHAFKIYGQKTIDGCIYLMAQLSNGSEIGDKGIFYIPRGVVNSEFTFGAFTFKDVEPEKVRESIETGKQIPKKESWIKRLLKLIL